MIRSRLVLACIASLLASAALASACGGASSSGGATVSPAATGQPPSQSPTAAATTAQRAVKTRKVLPTVTPTAVPLTTPGIKVRDLVAAPNTDGFEATFAWARGIPTGATGLFVWRQGHGFRRFDFSAGGGHNPVSGWTAIESGLDQTALLTLSPAITYCLWFGEAAGNISMSCGPTPPSTALTDALFLTLNADVTGTFPDRNIAGRAAKCYADNPGASGQGAICVDATTHEPLYVDVRIGATPEQQIEATNLTTANPNLSIPANLPGDVGVSNAAKVAVSSFQFPSSFAWDK